MTLQVSYSEYRNSGWKPIDPDVLFLLESLGYKIRICPLNKEDEMKLLCDMDKAELRPFLEVVERV